MIGQILKACPRALDLFQLAIRGGAPVGPRGRYIMG